MLETLKYWYATYLANAKAAILIFIIVGASFFIWAAHDYLGPFILGLTFAYLLDRPVTYLEKMGCSRTLSVILILGGLCSGLVFGFCLLFALFKQFGSFTKELPNLIDIAQKNVKGALHSSPLFLSFGEDLFLILKTSATSLSQSFLNHSMAFAFELMWFLADLLLAPFIAFFCLKDKALLSGKIKKILPSDSNFLTELLTEVDKRMHRYVLGKVIEFLVVWAAAALLFYTFGLRHQAILAFGVGVSTILPYLGVLLISIPVVLIAIAQWGFSSYFTVTLLSIYFILQFLEGNLLASFLCAEAVDLHPLTIALSISIFGGLWGLSGMIFAVPIATLIKVIIVAWPKQPLFSSPGDAPALSL